MVSRLKDYTVPVSDPGRWLRLREMADVTNVLTPVEVKAYYVFGLIHEIGQSVGYLMTAPDAWPAKYLPAISIFASAIELMGRCLTGNTTDSVNANLRVGFYYLAHPTEYPPPKDISDADCQKTVVKTTQAYSVADLVALRHYGAHGQATVGSGLPTVDNELLEALRDPFGTAIETYWCGLVEGCGVKANTEFCIRMGEAKVVPYAGRDEPLINIVDLAAGGQSMSQWVFNSNWSVR